MSDVTTDEQKARRAMEVGAEAMDAGMLEKDNPFYEHTPEWYGWLIGFYNAALKDLSGVSVL